MDADPASPNVFTVQALAPGPTSAAEMRTWKQLVRNAAALRTPLALKFDGGAHPITAYRLFYMLVYAKEAGVTPLSFHCDGRILDDEASQWLAESGVDEIVIKKTRV